MYTDIHSHIIPGLDDGAPDMETALSMLKIAYENGTFNIVATPHFIYGYTKKTAQDFISACIELENRTHQEGINLAIRLGCEVFICPELPELYEKGIISTIGDTSYLLVELPTTGIPNYTDQVLYDLQLKGVTPIIAHPERNCNIMKNPEILVKMVSRGILAQINSGSITGLYGKSVKCAALKLIKMGAIQLVGSDAHNTKGRSPDLTKAANIIGKMFGAKLRNQLFIDNGWQLLNNNKVEINLKDSQNKCHVLKKLPANN